MRYLLFSLVSVATLAADEAPVCVKCEKIREYNAAHPENNYYYYEDYLKDQAKKDEKNHFAANCKDPSDFPLPEDELPLTDRHLACANCMGKGKERYEGQEREDHLLACCGKCGKPKSK